MSHISPHSLGSSRGREPGHLEPLRDQVRGLALGVRQLGMRVQMTTERDQLGPVAVEERGRATVVSGSVVMAADTRCRARR